MGFAGDLKEVLEVQWSTPERASRRAAAEKLRRAEIKKEREQFAARRALNGPDGTIIMTSGRQLKFIRFGDLKERSVINIGNTPISDVARIEFSQKCCDFVAILRNGRRETFNFADFEHLRPATGRYAVSYVSSMNLRMVVVDPTSGQPYTRYFMGFQGIRSLVMDPNVESWRNKSDSVIHTNLNPLSALRKRRYLAGIRRRAERLHAQARADGWLAELPHGKLPPWLSRYVIDNLRQESSGSACVSDWLNGVTSLEQPLKCSEAEHELNILDNGFALDARLTPLATIIMVDRLRSDFGP